MKDGGSAFPIIRVKDEHGYEVDPIEYGMSIRDYFAAKAMPFMAEFNSVDGKAMSFEAIAKHAYELADAMMLERDK